MHALLLATLFAIVGCATSSSPRPTIDPGEEPRSDEDRRAPIEVTETPPMRVDGMTMVGGRVTPYGVSGNQPMMVLGPPTGDPTYGFSAQNPVRVGGMSEAAERSFLNSLFGPDGQPIFYERIGSCCSSPEGRGPLDAFRVTYEGLGERPLVLYLDVYREERPRVPAGFTSVGARR